MKFSALLGFVVICSLLNFKAAMAADASTAAVKIGYVDLQKAMATVEAGKSVKDQLEKELTAKRTSLEKAQASLQAEAEAFEKKAAIMNDAAKAAKQAELQKKFAEFQKNAAESQMELQKRERDLTQPLITEMRTIIEGLGKEKGFQLIVEKNEGAVLYAEAGSDLTDQMIEKFNARQKSKPKKK